MIIFMNKHVQQVPVKHEQRKNEISTKAAKKKTS